MPHRNPAGYTSTPTLLGKLSLFEDHANTRSCDGDRLLFDGASLIVVNGKCVAQGSQFGASDVEVITAVCDLEAVRAKRNSSSRNQQAVQVPTYRRIESDFSLSADELDLSLSPTPPRAVFYHRPEEEIAYGPAAWLWDYLRRSGMAGFLLPLSGGIDSCVTAVLVFSMARMVHKSIQEGNKTVLNDCRRIAGPYEKKDWMPSSPQAIMKNLMHTLYMGMKTQSSSETRKRARDLSEAIGSYHLEADIDRMFNACKDIGTESTGFEPNFEVHGGTSVENLALQNIQARSRMVLAYYHAQMLPLSRGRPGGGGLLVLGSANVDESLRGYLTKYDASSADVSPSSPACVCLLSR
jgi:NAD+ synthase (glutamine-hydrolysing)